MARAGTSFVVLSRRCMALAIVNAVASSGASAAILFEESRSNLNTGFQGVPVFADSDLGTDTSEVLLNVDNLARSFVKTPTTTGFVGDLAVEVRLDQVGGEAGTEITRIRSWGASGLAPGASTAGLGTISFSGIFSPTDNFLETRYDYVVLDDLNRELGSFSLELFIDSGLEVRAGKQDLNGLVSVPVTVTPLLSGDFSISQTVLLSMALPGSGVVRETASARMNGDGAPRFIDFAHTFHAELAAVDPQIQIVDAPAPVPLPAALWLFGAAAGALVGGRRRSPV